MRKSYSHKKKNWRTYVFVVWLRFILVVCTMPYRGSFISTGYHMSGEVICTGYHMSGKVICTG